MPAVAQHAIHDPVGDRLGRRHEVVALHVGMDSLNLLARMLGVDLIYART